MIARLVNLVFVKVNEKGSIVTKRACINGRARSGCSSSSGIKIGRVPPIPINHTTEKLKEYMDRIDR